MKIELIPFQRLGDERGGLVALENSKNIPFAVRRVYYLIDTKFGVRRGYHAHRKLRQLAVAIRGACTFLLDDGSVKKEIRLDDPTQGLLIEGLIWREMYDFTSDCALMVLADAEYDESDYIRNYHEFLESVRQVEVQV